MTRTLKSFLGPFYGIVDYPETYGQEDFTVNQYSQPYHTPDYVVIDFDVRPQRIMLDRTLRSKFAKPIDWVDVQNKAVAAVGRMLRGALGPVFPCIEGICSDGTLTCTMVVELPIAMSIRNACEVIVDRIKTKHWRYQDNNPDSLLVQAAPYIENGIPIPKLDRVGFDVVDHNNRKAIPMVAENFYATTDTNRTFPLCQWSALATLIEEN